MSESNNNVEKGFEVDEPKLVITPEDAKAAFEFWDQFEVPVMPGLREAFEKFQTEPTVENQEYLKFMICKAVSTTDHEAFKEETFVKVVEECAEVAYDMGFNREFEKLVTTEE